jgi:hypothetical protein
MEERKMFTLIAIIVIDSDTKIIQGGGTVKNFSVKPVNC